MDIYIYIYYTIQCHKMGENTCAYSFKLFYGTVLYILSYIQPEDGF